MNKTLSLSHSIDTLDRMITDTEHTLINLKSQKQVYESYLQDEFVKQVQQSCTVSCPNGQCSGGSCYNYTHCPNGYCYYPKTSYY